MATELPIIKNIIVPKGGYKDLASIRILNPDETIKSLVGVSVFSTCRKNDLPDSEILFQIRNSIDTDNNIIRFWIEPEDTENLTVAKGYYDICVVWELGAKPKYYIRGIITLQNTYSRPV